MGDKTLTPTKQQQIDHFTFSSPAPALRSISPCMVGVVCKSVGPYGAHHTLKKLLGVHRDGGTS